MLPMIAVVIPAPERSEMSLSTGASAPGYRKLTLRSSTDPRRGTSVTGSAASTTDDRVSRTSWMRSDDTAARGTRMAMNVAIITAIRIWVR